MIIQVEWKLREFEIDVSRQTLRTTDWKTKTRFPYNEGVRWGVLIRLHCCYAQEEDEEEIYRVLLKS